jgi:queuosine precursor transporter
LTRTVLGVVASVALLATVVGANWMLGTFGVVTVFGAAMPAGVLFAGLAFGVRDVIHETVGALWVIAAIAAGSVLSYVISDGASIPGGVLSIALASAVAFAVSEALDLAVYAPLRKRQWVRAVVASNIFGAVADSLLFLWLAFGSIAFAAGQVVGKALMIIPVLPVVAWSRRAILRDRFH